MESNTVRRDVKNEVCSNCMIILLKPVIKLPLLFDLSSHVMLA